jgi:hypothetical protein
LFNILKVLPKRHWEKKAKVGHQISFEVTGALKHSWVISVYILFPQNKKKIQDLADNFTAT